MQVIITLLILISSACFAQTSVILAPAPIFQSVTQSGTPNGFGCVFTYVSGTTTPLATYTDSTGTTQNANPVVLSAAGTGNIWIKAGTAYSFVVKAFGGTNCSTGQTIYTVRGISGGTSQVVTEVTYSTTPQFNITAQNQLFTLTLTGNAAALPLAFSGVQAPSLITFEITQDGVGGHTFTWPSNVIGGMLIGTSGNVTNGTTASQTISQMFVWDGTNAYAVGWGTVGSSLGGAALGAPSVVYSNSVPVTQTGDTSAHTLYTIPIAGNLLATNRTLRITLAISLGGQGGSAVLSAAYGGTTITPLGTINSALANTNGIYFSILGGNSSATNAQIWDTLSIPLSGNSALGVGNINHKTSAIDSTASQNLTVVFQGGANTDSITVERVLVEIL